MLPLPLEREGFNFMSINQTASYGLHLWEPGDDFLREEFNDNFAALDAAARVVCGGFTGNGVNVGDEQEIVLGFRPRAIYVTMEDGTNGVNYLTLDGVATTMALFTITDNGFRSRYLFNRELNAPNRFYYYWAVR